MPDLKPSSFLKSTTDIVAAHLSHNDLTAEQLPVLSQSIYQALSSVDLLEIQSIPAHRPAVPVKKSVFPDFIFCLEDGKKLKMLKCHPQTS